MKPSALPHNLNWASNLGQGGRQRYYTSQREKRKLQSTNTHTHSFPTPSLHMPPLVAFTDTFCNSQHLAPLISWHRSFSSGELQHLTYVVLILTTMRTTKLSLTCQVCTHHSHMLLHKTPTYPQISLWMPFPLGLPPWHIPLPHSPPSQPFHPTLPFCYRDISLMVLSTFFLNLLVPPPKPNHTQNKNLLAFFSIKFSKTCQPKKKNLLNGVESWMLLNYFYLF